MAAAEKKHLLFAAAVARSRQAIESTVNQAEVAIQRKLVEEAANQKAAAAKGVRHTTYAASVSTALWLSFQSMAFACAHACVLMCLCHVQCTPSTPCCMV
jgi:hypothetical protein